MSLNHFLLQFTRVSIGVDDVAWVNIAEIYKVLAAALIRWVYSSNPMVVFSWCMHSIWMAHLFVVGSIHNSSGIVGSS